MHRRTLLAAPLLLPAAARADGPPPLIGVLRVGGPSNEQFAEIFRRDMARLGHEEGRTYRTQYAFADGQPERLPGLAADLVKAGARMLLAFGNPGTVAAQAATRDLPIVAMADDLEAWKLVASMARPGGNTTGVSIMGYLLDVKRLEVLHEIVPQAKKIGIVMDDGVALPGELDKLLAAAGKLGLATEVLYCRTPDKVGATAEALASTRVDAVQFLASPVLNATRGRFVAEMARLRLPAMYEWPETVEEGGLASYGPRIALCYRHVAVSVAKVLRGARPADLPVEQPTTFTLALNTGAAKAIGLQLPSDLLLRADVVID